MNLLELEAPYWGNSNEYNNLFLDGFFKNFVL